MRRFVSVIGLALLCAASAQSTQYVSATTPLLPSATGSAIGKLLPGTPVKVISTSGKLSQVSFQGWSTQKGPKTIYGEMGVRMGVANLNDAKAPGRKVLSSKTDSYKAVWEQVEVTGWVESAKLTKDQKAVWNAAKTLYAKGCGSCHAAHPADAHTANEWVGVFKGMLPRTSLTTEQADLVLKYLQANAKK